MLPEKECSDSVWNSYIGQYLYEQLTNTCMSSMLLHRRTQKIFEAWASQGWTKKIRIRTSKY
jgi:hypothetical protein